MQKNKNLEKTLKQYKDANKNILITGLENDKIQLQKQLQKSQKDIEEMSEKLSQMQGQNKDKTRIALGTIRCFNKPDQQENILFHLDQHFKTALQQAGIQINPNKTMFLR